MSLSKKKPVSRKNMKVRCAILLAAAFPFCGVSFAQAQEVQKLK
jgi:phosphate/sulfate permease